MQKKKVKFNDAFTGSNVCLFPLFWLNEGSTMPDDFPQLIDARDPKPMTSAPVCVCVFECGMGRWVDGGGGVFSSVII